MQIILSVLMLSMDGLFLIPKDSRCAGNFLNVISDGVKLWLCRELVNSFEEIKAGTEDPRSLTRQDESWWTNQWLYLIKQLSAVLFLIKQLSAVLFLIKQLSSILEVKKFQAIC